MSVSADLLLSRPGNVDAVSVPAGEIACSWAIGQAGALSARIPKDGLAVAGIADPLGWWVRWEHRTAGAWGGVITDVSYDLGDGTIELAAQSFAALLEARRTARSYEQASAAAGALAVKAIADVNRADPTLLDSWTADETGDAVKLEWRGDDLLKVLRALADASGQEWLVDEDRNFVWRTRVGTTRHGVQLLQGVHITGGSLDRSLKPVVNDLLAVAGNKAFKNAPARSYESAESITAYGRREGSKVYPNLRAISALEARARRDVAALGTPPLVASLDVADVNEVWASLREGDIVWVVLPAADVCKRMRILARSVDVEAGLMQISGPLELTAAVAGSEPVFEVGV